jgi:hypothetical protein
MKGETSIVKIESGSPTAQVNHGRLWVDEVGVMVMEPIQLLIVAADDSGWNLCEEGGQGRRWCSLQIMKPGDWRVIVLDPNFPSFVDVFEHIKIRGEKGFVTGEEYAPKGRAVLLGWNEEVQEEVHSIGEVLESEWIPADSVPLGALLWVRDHEGRRGLSLHEMNRWMPLAGGVEDPKEWFWLGRADVEGVALDQEGGFLAQNNPSDASDGFRTGGERGGAIQGDSTPTRTAAENGGADFDTSIG